MRAVHLRRTVLCLLLLTLLAGCGAPMAKTETLAPQSPAEEAVPAAAPVAAETPAPAPQAPPSETPAPEPEREKLPKICIDPGHYAGINCSPEPESWGYCEGDFNLRVALALQRILAERYGIESCLTRTGGSISIGGYTDRELDGSHLSLRGRYAEEMGCDLFISLHTNGNQDDVNDSPTWLQPLSITKTVVIVNLPCRDSERWLGVANAIGAQVTAVNNRLEIADGRAFVPVTADTVPEWTDEWNDSATLPGSVFCRLRDGEDYYSVLHGAAEVGVPGMIVEHGFHTVAEMRRLAATGDLAELWAEADAAGIAAGLGLHE